MKQSHRELALALLMSFVSFFVYVLYESDTRGKDTRRNNQRIVTHRIINDFSKYSDYLISFN